MNYYIELKSLLDGDWEIFPAFNDSSCNLFDNLLINNKDELGSAPQLDRHNSRVSRRS